MYEQSTVKKEILLKDGEPDLSLPAHFKADYDTISDTKSISNQNPNNIQ